MSLEFITENKAKAIDARVRNLTSDTLLTSSGLATFVAFKLSTGASSGRVLTSDASGNGSWQVPVLPPGTTVSSDDEKVVTVLNGPGFTDPYTFHVTSLAINGVSHVTLHLPSDIQPAPGPASLLTFNDPIPLILRPTVSSGLSFFVQAVDNSVQTLALLNITSSGVITIGIGPGQSNFTGAGNCGIGQDIFVSWDLSSNV